jgi:phosphatidylserine/phosphatidylglycerophosphate/cardiolipin synthase-like enzyme
MRVRETQSSLTVNAVAGCHVVLMGLDIAPARRRGLRGFAIRRTDPTEGETYWMKGAKTFRSVEPHPGAGEQFSSLHHPFQSFQWADYSVKPDRDYAYDIVPMYGRPGALTPGDGVNVAIHTEPVEGSDHTVLFNRGSVATQEYARRFQNQWPSKVGEGAYDWLSRGLLEGVLGFIRRAKDGNWGLKGAFYELQWPAVLEALRDARRRGADVKVVFDAIEGDSGPKAKNETAIGNARIKGLCIPRTNGTLMHNKFLVLTHRGKPQALLFGSTNMTENGIFGHANCVHLVEEAEVAAQYLAYFETLRDDPLVTGDRSYKEWTEAHSPAPAEVARGAMAPVFSPRPDIASLRWYADLAGAARRGLFMTFAFGMHEFFREVYGRDDGLLRMALMEKEWNGQNKEAQIARIRALQALPSVVIAIGNRIPLSGLDQWLGEMDRLKREVNVRWVHTKFMLADPLSDDPVVVTGSANFSKASTDTNDENMLVIRGNTRVADIYLGEFFRLHSHYAFRQAVGIFLKEHPDRTVEDFAARFLIEEEDWTADYFQPGDRNARYARRRYFAGEG